MQSENIESTQLLRNKLQLIILIEKLIKSVLSQTKNLPSQASIFDCKTIPNIPVGDYLKRIAKYSHCSPSVYVLALIYIDRVQQMIENFILSQKNIHRLVICCMMIAAKWADDFYYKNQYYAKIGGISKKQIDELQQKLLININFCVFVSEKQFINYLQKLQTYQHINGNSQ